MGNILVGVIVAAALFYCIKRVVNALKGKSSCNCGCDGCTPCQQKACDSPENGSGPAACQ